MIEHTLYYMGRFLFVEKFQHVYELWPTDFFARPGQILGRLQCKTMYLYTSKTAPIQPFDMISSSRQVFYAFWSRLLHIQKSKNILFWPSYCTKSKLDNLLVGPSRKKKSETVMIFFENFLDDYYSACIYLQFPYLRVFFWSNIFYFIFI
jgi:hypothetical protein